MHQYALGVHLDPSDLHGDLVVAPDDRIIVQVYGGQRWGGVRLTPDQVSTIRNWLGLHRADEDDAYAVVADDLTAMRAAEEHGLRMVAYLARYLSPGEDPVRALNELMIEAGWAVEQWEDESSPLHTALNEEGEHE